MEKNISKVTGRTKITLYANVEGRMWWPSDLVDFPINETFYKGKTGPFENEFTGLRDALLKLQSSGDYQNLSFTEPVEVLIERQTDWIDNDIHRAIKTVIRRKVCFVEPSNQEYVDLFA